MNSNTLEMKVENTGFLLDRLAEDCGPLQFLRELTQNGIEAIGRTGETGEIVWDVDWRLFDRDGVYKISVTDTGDGMTGEQMKRHINSLSSSGGVQSFSQNYGIAAASRNPEGLVYLSWRDGQGAMIHMWKDPTTGKYGLKQLDLGEEIFTHCAPVDDSAKPAPIGAHGTTVILLGVGSDDNTMQPPEGTRSASRWVTRYLNTRYFRFPTGVTVKAREGWTSPRADTDRNVLRTIQGQEDYLRTHAQSSGAVDVGGALAHWWILRDEPALTQNSGNFASGGHIAALYQDELYEITESRPGMGKLQNFGVVLGHGRVVIYVEPSTQLGHLTTNTSRTNLLINSAQLPWAEWASEFRAKMPDEIQQLIADIASKATAKDHQKSIRERLEQIKDLWRLSRYRPTPRGTFEVDQMKWCRPGEDARAAGEAVVAAEEAGGRPA